MSQPCLSFGFWVSAYGLPHGTCYTRLLNLTSARCRSACMSRDVLLLRVRHTDGIGIQRLVKQISVLLSTHPIGDTVGSVPSLLFPNTSAPTDFIKNLSRIPVSSDFAYSVDRSICLPASHSYAAASRICSTFSFAASTTASPSCLISAT